MLCQRLTAQQITNEEVFAIKDYSVFEYGYPLMVAPAGGDDFLFIEYWPAVNHRAEANYYLQKYRITNYDEMWFKPLTTIGYDQIPEVIGLYKMDKKYVVVGHQYSQKEKRQVTVARFFESDGKVLDLEPTVISKYTSKAPKKDISEKLYTSPSDKMLMWFSAAADRYYVTAWSGTSGAGVWEKDFALPNADKYAIEDATIDDKGNATFLLMAKKRTNSIKDTANKPMLCRYHPESGKFTYLNIKLDSNAYMLRGHLKLLSNNEAVVGGVLSNFDPKLAPKAGIKNGDKAGVNDRWTHFYTAKFKVSNDSVSFLTQKMEPLPDNWKKKYEAGSNFTYSEMVIEPGVVTKGIDPTAIMVFEEQYKQDDKIFFADVAYVGFRINNTSYAFSDFFSKKQRDQGKGEYLSYSLGKTKGKMHFVYVTEMGAAGKLLCQSVDLKTGQRTEKFLAKNDQSLYYFFTARSKMVSASQMVLIGTGNPSQNNFKLITITF